MLDVEVVRSKLAEQNLSISELARKMDSHRPDVSAWVNGRQEPTLKTAAKLAAALGCTVDDLLSTGS